MIKPTRSNRTTRVAHLPDRRPARRHRADACLCAGLCHSDGSRDQLPGPLIAIGDPVPPVGLTALEGEWNPAAYASGWLLVWCFPGDDDELFSVDEVMGRSFEEHRLELAELGCALVGVSSQHRDTLTRLAYRSKTTFPLLSDPQLVLAQRMGLPMVPCGEVQLYRRLVFIAHRGRVARVFHRVRPLASVDEVVGWLARQSRAGGL